MPLRSYIINTYEHLLLGFQFMFMELFKEMYRRMKLFPTPKGNSYIKANEELKKIVKRLKKKTTEEEFIESRVLPILEKEEKTRIKNFKKIYGRNMSKWHIEILNMSIFLKCNFKVQKIKIAL